MLPFVVRFQPYLGWYGIVSTIATCFFSSLAVFPKGAWVTVTFMTNYYPLLVLIPILYIGVEINGHNMVSRYVLS